MKILNFILHRDFEKDMTKHSVEVRRVFLERKNLLMIDPNHSLLNNHPLHGKWQGCWSINVTGNIRAIFRIQSSVAVFLAIDTHSNLYK